MIYEHPFKILAWLLRNGKITPSVPSPMPNYGIDMPARPPKLSPCEREGCEYEFSFSRATCHGGASQVATPFRGRYQFDTEVPKLHWGMFLNPSCTSADCRPCRRDRKTLAVATYATMDATKVSSSQKPDGNRMSRASIFFRFSKRGRGVLAKVASVGGRPSSTSTTFLIFRTPSPLSAVAVGPDL